MSTMADMTESCEVPFDFKILDRKDEYPEIEIIWLFGMELRGYAFDKMVHEHGEAIIDIYICQERE